MMKSIWKRTLNVLLLGLLGGIAPASADCCGPPPAPPREVQLAEGWSGFVMYERMEMNSLIRGTERVSPDQVLVERLRQGAQSFSVPTDMQMDRATLQLNYRFDEAHSVRVSVPWRWNRMDMRMASTGGGGHGAHSAHSGHSGSQGGHHRSALPNQMQGHHHLNDHDHDHSHDHNHEAEGGGEHHGPPEHGHGESPPPDQPGHGLGPHVPQHPAHPVAASPSFMDHAMAPVDGLGDIALNYTYTLPLEGGQVYLGAGVQFPTGRWDLRDSGGQLVHNMMQPGTGALGLTGELGGDIELGDSNWSLHPRLGVLWTAPNPLGYQRGSRFDYELGARYQPTPQFGLGLDLTGFTLGGDTTNGTLDPLTGQVAFQRPETSLVDDVNNTGGQFLFIAPSLQLRPSDGISLGFQYRLPLYQRVKGTQLGIDAWYRAYLSARF